ncbi:hypothetical protein ABH14_17165 [Brevibacillus brevis]|uniref:ABC transporter substrate-binding protein n=1 Tax=Brevibacillus brevis TaxID=1393 RepID=UPI0018FF8E69|nr:ABC transporter substrate-binding protein [Brevibacillus brevis]MBH0331503.1 hypothetical protein [Brevibacillus brevis]
MKSILRHVTRVFVSSLVAFTFLVGCSTNTIHKQTEPANASSEATSTITLFTPKAPSLIPALYMEQKEASPMFKITKWDTIEQLLAGIQNKEAPLFAAPINVGANLYAKGMPVQLLHVNTWGSMYMISLDPAVNDLSKLENETVYIPGQSGPPDILTKYLLEKKGQGDKVNLAYGAIPDIMQQLAAGTIKHAVLPEPVLSGLRLQVKGKVNEVVDYQKAWQESFGEDLPQTGVFANREWARAHPDEVARFQKSYEKAVQKTNEQPIEILKLAADAFGMPEAALIQAMPKITLIYKDAQAAKPEVERYFKLLLQFAPDSIGGSLPNADFYYGS